MALIPASIVDRGFVTDSGALVQKIAVPAIIPSSEQSFRQLDTRLFDRPEGRRKRRQDRADLPAEVDERFFAGYWAEKSHAIIGSVSAGFTEDRSFDLGNVLTNQERLINIYNARALRPINVIDVSITNPEGISIDDTIQPDFLDVFKTKTYTLTVSQDGPPVINSTVAFTTDQGEVFEFTITGDRTLVVPFVPQRPILEGLRYKTWIKRSSDGTEQRQGMRNIGGETLSYVFRGDERALSAIENFFFNRQNSLFGLPLLHFATVLSAPVTAGGLQFNVADDPQPRFFRAGDNESLALIFGGEFNFEAVQVDNISGLQFTTTQALQNDWPAGTLVLPVRRSYMLGPQSSPFVQNFRDFSVSFEVVSNLETPDASSFSTYESLPVFDQLQLLSGSQFRRDYDTAVTRFDPGAAPGVVNTQQKSPQVTWGFFREFESLEEYKVFRDFYQDRHGRRKPFWISTDLRDFEINEDQLAGTNLRISNARVSELFNSLGTSTRRRHIRIEYVDGSVDYRQISAASQVSNEQESITLSSAASQDLTAANVAKISWLLRVRFGEDEIQFEHENQEQISVALAVVEVEG